jgi:GMP reductase
MRIISDIKLDFKDVLIVPKRSGLKSRKDVNLIREFNFKHGKYKWEGLPVVTS